MNCWKLAQVCPQTESREKVPENLLPDGNFEQKEKKMLNTALL